MSKRPLIIAVVVALLATVGFWTQILGPKKKEAADVKVDVATAQSTLQATRQQAAELRDAKSGFAGDYTSVIRLGKAVPTDDDMRSLMVQIDGAAKRSGVEFRSIQLSGGGGTSTPPPAGTGSAATQAATAVLPPGASVGTAGFPTMPFSFEFEGKFFTLSNFFARLDRFVKLSGDDIDVAGRLLTVDAFTLIPGAQGFPSVSASVGATAYLLPGSTGATLPTPGATQAVSTTATAPAAPAAGAATASTTPPTGAVR